MSFESHELLGRLAEGLRREIAPAVDGEYLRTQAHMAAVILERLAREAALGERHRTAEAADLAELASGLGEIADIDGASQSQAAPEEVRSALARLQDDPGVMSLGPMVEALYRWGPERPAAAAALDAIRSVLRRDIDRRMDIAR
ncbi:hypothetical protein [Candidatus Poriferisodalis sp.]|uniref:hypothetical protein n=1 Tax=Candidatus Poriferisodalis sp. TaxID=3101277 RepID=UPI003B01B85E